MLQPHEIRYGEHVFRRLNSAGDDEPNHDRGTGYVLRDKPVHAGASLTIPPPLEMAVHAGFCGLREQKACDCGAYERWKAMTGGIE